MEKPIIRKVVTDKKRLPQTVIKLINRQIEREIESSHIYWAMAIWLNFNGYKNSYPVFEKYALEERSHAEKFIGYLLDKDIKPIFPAINTVASEFEDLVQILRKSYEHECFVTDSINEISTQAHEECDYTTVTFLNWFIAEQIEEEAKFKNLLDSWDIFMVSNSNRGLALMELDEMVGDN